jgi:uncharacterized protein YggE
MSTIRRTIPLAVLVLVAGSAVAAHVAGAQPTKVRKEQPATPRASRPDTATTTGVTTRSAAAPPVQEIVVTATKRSRVAADRATISLLVDGTADDAPFAAQHADAALVNVSEAIRQLGSAATTLGVTPLGVVETPNVSGFRHIPGQPWYLARYVVRVQVARPADVQSVATTALAAGARVTPPSFESATADSARRATYADALAQARRDAEAIAESMGARLGDVVDVTTTEPPPAEDALLPGSEQDVATSVRVRYRLLPR